MTFVVVTTEVENRTTRRRDPEDRWDIGDEEGRVTNVTGHVVTELQNYYGDSHGKDIPDLRVGDVVYAVVADYSSGCTFGRTGAQGKVLDFFTDRDEAQALATAALKKDGNRKDWGGNNIPYFEYSFEFNGVEYSRDWVGYFEDLQSLDVWQVTVRANFYQSSRVYGGELDPGFRIGS